MGVGKGRDQSTLAQLHNGSVTVLLWQLIANIDDAAAVLHQITADLVAWIDGENVPMIDGHARFLLTERFMISV